MSDRERHAAWKRCNRGCARRYERPRVARCRCVAGMGPLELGRMNDWFGATPGASNPLVRSTFARVGSCTRRDCRAHAPEMWGKLLASQSMSVTLTASRTEYPRTPAYGVDEAA